MQVPSIFIMLASAIIFCNYVTCMCSCFFSIRLILKVNYLFSSLRYRCWSIFFRQNCFLKVYIIFSLFFIYIFSLFSISKSINLIALMFNILEQDPLLRWRGKSSLVVVKLSLKTIKHQYVL